MDNRIAYGIYQRYVDNGHVTNLANGPMGFLYDKDEAEIVAQRLYGDLGFVQETNPDHFRMWGAGRGSQNHQTGEFEFKIFEKTRVGDEEVGLFFGEHRHSDSSNNIYAQFPDGRIEGFSGHRLLHTLIFQDHNYLKSSGLSGDEVRKGGKCRIYINDMPCGQFFFRDIFYALHEARNYIEKIHDFPLQLWKLEERKEIVGRKIYYRNHPAIITRAYWEEMEIFIEADGEKKIFPYSSYELEDLKEYGQTDREDEIIKDSIFSSQINWFRS